MASAQSGSHDAEDLNGLPAQAEGSDPLSQVDNETRIASVDFEFPGGNDVSRASLKEELATQPPAWSPPLLGRSRAVYFHPFELQKDLARITRYHARNGFPEAKARYQLDFDRQSNRVKVLFVVDQGSPLLIRNVSVAGPGLADVTEQLPSELHADWRRFSSSIQLREGVRFDASSLESLRRETQSWFRERGYAFADASAESYPDLDELRTDVRLKVLVGPRARYDEIAVEGTELISPGIVKRELPFREGDWFRASDLSEGQREIFGLNLFSLALVDLEPDQPIDSTASVRIRVRESNPRRLSALAGYYTRGGLTGRLEASHLNVFGGARSLTATLEARSGIFGTESVPTTDSTRARSVPISDYLASLTFRQPYVFDRRLSLAISPQFRRRDDEIERSDQISLTSSLIFEKTAFQTATLSATIRSRTFFPDRQQTLSILNSQEFSALDSLQTTTTSLALGATVGWVDDPLNPREGLIVRPTLRTTGLLPFSDLHFVRGSLTAIGLLPLGERIGASLRLTGGGINPFRGTDEGNLVDYTLLRDQLLYSGGTSDVRGWGEGQLGPKIFNMVLVRERDPDNPDRLVVTDTVALGYLPLGGTSKLSGSLQLDVPLPLGEKLGASVFIDAGRVFGASQAYYDLIFDDEGGIGSETNDSGMLRNRLIEPSRWRVGAGAGILYDTPVGFINLSLGYKLNPSYLDVRDPEDVVDFFFDPSVDLDDRASAWRRLQVHFSIGRTF